MGWVPGSRAVPAPRNDKYGDFFTSTFVGHAGTSNRHARTVMRPSFGSDCGRTSASLQQDAGKAVERNLKPGATGRRGKQRAAGQEIFADCVRRTRFDFTAGRGRSRSISDEPKMETTGRGR